MNENTRIEEMARVMCGNREKSCLLCPIQSPCLMRNCAELLNAEGYRKASEVASEIFARLEELMTKLDKRHMMCGNPKQSWGVRSAIVEIAELKKKYTEEDEDENS